MNDRKDREFPENPPESEELTQKEDRSLNKGELIEAGKKRNEIVEKSTVSKIANELLIEHDWKELQIAQLMDPKGATEEQDAIEKLNRALADLSTEEKTKILQEPVPPNIPDTFTEKDLALGDDFDAEDIIRVVRNKLVCWMNYILTEL